MRPLAAVSDVAYLGILRLLEASPSRSQRELARELGLSLGKTNYLMRALLGRGLVKVRNFRNSSNKRAYVYLMTPKGVAAKAQLTRAFLARKIQEYDALRLEIERLQQEAGAVGPRAQALSGSRHSLHLEQGHGAVVSH